MRVVGQTKSRKIPTQIYITALFRDKVARRHINLVDTIASGNFGTVWRAKLKRPAQAKRNLVFSEWCVFLNFVRRSGTTRAAGPHGAHVRGAKRNRVDRRPRFILPPPCRPDIPGGLTVAAKVHTENER